MTIMGLFKKHGVDMPRTVLPSGRIQFGAATASQGMPMPAGTFHGGDAPEDAEHSGDMWWHDSTELERDRAAMSAWFPGFIECTPEGDRPPVWGGVIDTGKGKFNVLVVHRRDHGLPTIVPVDPIHGRRVGRRLVQPPHTYTNGDLCVASSDDWDPARDSAATAVAWAAHWLAFYVEWFYTQRWPADSYCPRAA